MPSIQSSSSNRMPCRSLASCLSFAVVLAAFCFAPTRVVAQEHKGAGVTVSGDVDAKDLGLPLYPGSRRHRDKDEDSPAANLGLWGGGSGFKLAVIKMESNDSFDKVSDYYRKALARYGKVLDCTHPSPEDSESANGASSNRITCGDDQAEKGGMLFKAGTKEKQHIVAIQPHGQGALYQIVYVSAWSKDENK